MPISFKLTKKQVEILELAKRLDSFKQLSLNKKKDTEIKESFLQDLTKIYSLSKYKSNLRLEDIFFKFESPDTEVPPEYVPRETDEIPRFRNPRAIPKQTFISFRDNCGDDEYMLFGFHRNNFYLGYVRKDCVDGNCPIRFFAGEDSNPNNHERDLSQKKGILHTKDEFDNLLANVTNNGNIYLFRRKYKTPASRKSEQTVVLTNARTIGDSSSFDNVGGSCCPPQF